MASYSQDLVIDVSIPSVTDSKAGSWWGSFQHPRPAVLGRACGVREWGAGPFGIGSVSGMAELCLWGLDGTAGLLPCALCSVAACSSLTAEQPGLCSALPMSV